MILQWFEESATGSELSVMILNKETQLSDFLMRQGYQKASDQPFFTHMTHDLVQLPEPILTKGWLARSIRGDDAYPIPANIYRSLGLKP